MDKETSVALQHVLGGLVLLFIVSVAALML
jgi:hypothetical protein